jgi:ABC-type sugar transport system substrate-binding protein
VFANDLIGKTIDGDFILQDRIGQGGMAVVFRARQISMNRDVALKMIDIRAEIAGLNQFPQRFANEAAFIAALEHPHILPVYAYGIYENYAYLAMRLLRGGTVKELLAHDQPLPIELAVNLFDQVARGLAYAHSKSIIHRDLKPANVLLDDHQYAYLSDFGLAKLANSEQHLTQSENILGTLAYMSPEHLRGERLDHRADIYSMGVMLYHMLTGRAPFRSEDGEDSIALIYKHLEQRPTPPTKFNPLISDDLEDVILKSLEKEPEDRYPSMGEMAQAVRNSIGFPASTQATGGYAPVAAALQQAAASSGGKSRRRAMRQRRQRLAIGIMGAIALIVLAIVAFVIVTQPTPIPDFTVVTNQTGKAENMTPSEEQIQLAQRQLGEEGFVAVMACNLSSEYHATLNREIVEFGRAYGLTFTIYDANSDGYQQRLELEKSLVDGTRGIVLCPLDINLLDETLKEIQERRKPLISTESEVSQYGGVATGILNFDMGLVAGRFAGDYIRNELAGNARVIILDFPDIPTIVERADGLVAGIRERAPNAEIIGRYQGGTREFAYEAVSELLAEGVTFDVIASINDAGSYGAIDALQEAGIAPEAVFISSIDAEQLAQEYIKEGYYMRGSLQVARRETAQVLVDIITRMLAGDAVPGRIIIPPGTMFTAETAASE